MSTMTVRVLVGSVIAACVLGVAALEVVSERVRVDLSPTVVPGTPHGMPDSAPVSVAELEFREEPGPSPSQLTGALQAGRHTVLNVDPAARRVLSLTGTGRVSVSEVDKEARVVTDETQDASLAFLKPGDVIRVEARSGQVQKIVVLRRGWQELESPEQ
jgi:hypothetical protein